MALVEMPKKSLTSTRGFASMDRETQLAIARKDGASVRKAQFFAKSQIGGRGWAKGLTECQSHTRSIAIVLPDLEQGNVVIDLGILEQPFAGCETAALLNHRVVATARTEAEAVVSVDPHHSYSAPAPTEAPPVALMAPFAFNCF